MSGLDREELISAYLDDELSPPERADIEKWLDTDPQAQQLFDDLRALRASVQSLPVVPPPPGFTSRVLAQVNQLTQPTEAIARPATSFDAGSLNTDTPTSWFKRFQRPLSWAGMAIAIALLVNYMGGEPEQNLALAPNAAPQPGESAKVKVGVPFVPSEQPALQEQTTRQMQETGVAGDAQPGAQFFAPPPTSAPDLQLKKSQTGGAAEDVLVVRGQFDEAGKSIEFLEKLLTEQNVTFQHTSDDKAPAPAPLVLGKPVTLGRAGVSIVAEGSEAQMKEVLARLSETSSPVQLLNVEAEPHAPAQRYGGAAVEPNAARGKMPTSRDSLRRGAERAPQQLKDQEQLFAEQPAASVRALFILEPAQAGEPTVSDAPRARDVRAPEE